MLSSNLLTSADPFSAHAKASLTTFLKRLNLSSAQYVLEVVRAVGLLTNGYLSDYTNYKLQKKKREREKMVFHLSNFIVSSLRDS